MTEVGKAITAAAFAVLVFSVMMYYSKPIEKTSDLTSPSRIRDIERQSKSDASIRDVEERANAAMIADLAGRVHKLEMGSLVAEDVRRRQEISPIVVALPAVARDPDFIPPANLP